MSDIIAGDPAPTNPTAAIREDILAGLRAAESGSVGDETPESLLDAYDAQVLSQTADWLKAVGQPQAAHLLVTLGGAR